MSNKTKSKGKVHDSITQCTARKLMNCEKYIHSFYVVYIVGISVVNDANGTSTIVKFMSRSGAQ